MNTEHYKLAISRCAQLCFSTSKLPTHVQFIFNMSMVQCHVVLLYISTQWTFIVKVIFLFISCNTFCTRFANGCRDIIEPIIRQ